MLGRKEEIIAGRFSVDGDNIVQASRFLTPTSIGGS